MIAIVDRLVVRGPDTLAIRDRYLSEYAPDARRRGMILREALTTPPVILATGENILTFVWAVPDLAGWWRMRLGGVGDPAVAAFWHDVDAVVVERTRTHNAMAAFDD